MSEKLAVLGLSVTGAGAFVVHPYAAIGAAFGCCFFLALPATARLKWWRRVLLSAFSFGVGYAAGAYFFDLEQPRSVGAMGTASGVAGLASAIFHGLNRVAENDGPLPGWLSDILDRVPFLKRGGSSDGGT